VRRAPLELVEGIESHDSLRLEEVGIDTCYDLATADFMPLMLKTPYSARQLIDWMLQAKLCVYFGDAVKNLRVQGFRTVIDVAQLTPKEIEALAAETALTQSALERAQQAAQHEAADLKRLREAGRVLGTFWDTGTSPHHPGNGHHDEVAPPSVAGARSPS
jgi:predicted RecB family nuclease